MEYRPKVKSGRTRRGAGPRKDGIAIIGMGFRLPGDAETADQFWSLLIEGRDAIGPVPDDRWDLEAYFHPDPARPGKMYTSAGGYVRNLDKFDADFFGISPREASRIDPQHRLLLEMAWEALESAGQSADRVAGSNASVYVGISGGDYGHIQYGDLEHVNAYTNVGSAASIAANRLSHFFDLRGPSMAVDTACSSSLVAMHEACQGLWSGEASMALVGGINLILRPQPTIGFCKASMLSPHNHCHSFGAGADGYVRAEGGGVFVLKPLAAAEADGDPIHGVILASGVNSDGHTKGIFLPSETAQAQLLREVYEEAGVRPRDVAYIEAHGTGTPAGDPIDAAPSAASWVPAAPTATSATSAPSSRTSVTSSRRPAWPGCSRCSWRCATGSCRPASTARRSIPRSVRGSATRGAAREYAAAPAHEAAHHGRQLLRVWRHQRPRRGAGVSSGGRRQAGGPTEVEVPLVLSAQHEDALKTLARGVAEVLRSKAAPSLYDVCHTAARRRSHLNFRLALRGSTAEEVAGKLVSFADGDLPEGAICEQSLSRPAKVAFVFCGNGPQWWAMGQQLLRENGQFESVVRAIDAIFTPMAGWSIMDELQSAEARSRMAGTEYAQPALFAIQLGVFEILKSRGLQPEAVLGHSVARSQPPTPPEPSPCSRRSTSSTSAAAVRRSPPAREGWRRSVACREGRGPDSALRWPRRRRRHQQPGVGDAVGRPRCDPRARSGDGGGRDLLSDSRPRLRLPQPDHGPDPGASAAVSQGPQAGGDGDPLHLDGHRIGLGGDQARGAVLVAQRARAGRVRRRHGHTARRRLRRVCRGRPASGARHVHRGMRPRQGSAGQVGGHSAPRRGRGAGAASGGGHGLRAGRGARLRGLVPAPGGLRAAAALSVAARAPLARAPARGAGSSAAGRTRQVGGRVLVAASSIRPTWTT